MSFDYNSQTWQPKTTNQHALDILGNINSILASENLPLLVPSLANVMWLFILGVAQMRADYDQKLYQASQSMNISNCTDDQVLNCLPVAGTQLNLGTCTTVVMTVVAKNTGSCFIPANSAIPYINGIIFYTQNDLTVSSGGTGTVVAQANITGEYVIDPNVLNSFTLNFTNLLSVTNNSASIPGINTETPQQVRQRLILGTSIITINSCISALRNLPGVNYAQVYFNPDISATLTLPGGITVAPRNARIYIYGASSLIAQTYVSYMNAPTPNTAGQNQIYTTLSGQNFTIYYDYATLENAYIRIYVSHNSVLTASNTLAIQNLVLTLGSMVNIGQAITQTMVDNLFIGFNGVQIVASDLSLDGTTWGNQQIAINANSVASFDISRIAVIQL